MKYVHAVNNEGQLTWTLTLEGREFAKVHAGFTEEDDAEGLDLLSVMKTVGEMDMSLISVLIAGTARMAMEVEKNEIPADSPLAQITEASRAITHEATTAYLESIKEAATATDEPS